MRLARPVALTTASGAGMMTPLMLAGKIACGLATFLPGLVPLAIRLRRGAQRRRAGGPNSARYCYSVWLRHLVRAARNGLDVQPAAVVEFGPGDSLGIGLAALLSGSETFYAVDVVHFADLRKNLRIFDDLADMFRRGEPIPDDREFPDVKPLLETYGFPSGILNGARMRGALSPGRIERIRDSISTADDRRGEGPVAYRTPWTDYGIIERQSVDMIYSQAAMEHVDDLPNAYRAMSHWLKPAGYVSHCIDFKSHGLARGWNGHWACSDFTWKLIRGRRPYLINRQPVSAHVALLQEQGFELREQTRTKREPAVPRERLAPGFREMSEDDLTTAGAFIQAQKT